MCVRACMGVCVCACVRACVCVNTIITIITHNIDHAILAVHVKTYLAMYGFLVHRFLFD